MARPSKKDNLARKGGAVSKAEEVAVGAVSKAEEVAVGGVAHPRPSIGKGAKAVHAAQVQQASKKLEIGWMGLVFGDVTEKPGNIAAAAIVLAFVLLAIVLFIVPEASNAITLLGSIITGALGFLFGRGRR